MTHTATPWPLAQSGRISWDCLPGISLCIDILSLQPLWLSSRWLADPTPSPRLCMPQRRFLLRLFLLKCSLRSRSQSATTRLLQGCRDGAGGKVLATQLRGPELGSLSAIYKDKHVPITSVLGMEMGRSLELAS